MDDLDKRLIVALQRDGRASLTELSHDLGVMRATVRARLDRLRESGEIAGFTVVTRADVAPHPVRGLMMLGVEGKALSKLFRQISAMPEVQAVHTTNGSWDLVAEVATVDLPKLDLAITRISGLPGVQRAETNLLLTTRRG